MRKTLAFASRNVKELLRDPLSYVFCLGFPLVMLVVMTLIDRSVPPEAGMTLFRIDRLCGGIAVFGQTFLMLFTCLTVSKDRSTSFLVRLYATPMTQTDFTAGYLLPILLLAVLQGFAVCLASYVISLTEGDPLRIWGLFFMLLTLLPSALFFASIGLLSGTLFSEKAAPGLCSVVISLGSFLGGIWFDAEGVGGVLLKICKALPFWYCVKAARSACICDFSWPEWGRPLIVVLIWAAGVTVLAAVCFRAKMRADKN